MSACCEILENVVENSWVDVHLNSIHEKEKEDVFNKWLLRKPD